MVQKNKCTQVVTVWQILISDHEDLNGSLVTAMIFRTPCRYEPTLIEHICGPFPHINQCSAHIFSHSGVLNFNMCLICALSVALLPMINYNWNFLQKRGIRCERAYCEKKAAKFNQIARMVNYTKMVSLLCLLSKKWNSWIKMMII